MITSKPKTSAINVVLCTAAGERSVKYQTPDERRAAGREMRQQLSDALVSLGLQQVFWLELSEFEHGYWSLKLGRWDKQPLNATVTGEVLSPEILGRIRRHLGLSDNSAGSKPLNRAGGVPPGADEDFSCAEAAGWERSLAVARGRERELPAGESRSCLPTE